MRLIYVIFTLALSLFLSCKDNKYKKVDVKDVVEEDLKSIDWSTLDKYPSLPDCHFYLDKDRNFNCFKKKMAKRIDVALKDSHFKVDSVFDTKIDLKIFISAKGKISFSNSISIFNNDEVNFQFLQIISESFSEIDSIIPAIKRGQYVKSEILLPVELTY